MNELIERLALAAGAVSQMLHGDVSLRDMQEADFDKAHAVGVPDRDALIAELKRYDAGFGMPMCGKAAAALTALQEQIAKMKHDAEGI